ATLTLRKLPFFLWIVPIGLAGLCGHFWNEQIVTLKENTRLMERNFYGTLRTKDIGTADSADGVRRLIHGVILHGEQYLSPARRHSRSPDYQRGDGHLLKTRQARRSDRLPCNQPLPEAGACCKSARRRSRSSCCTRR